MDRWQNKVADGTFQYFSKDEPSVTYLVLNQHTEDGATGGPSGVMLNPKCRKAIALAFDREEFNAMFKEGLVTTAYGVIPYGITVGEQEFRAANPRILLPIPSRPCLKRAWPRPAWQALPLT